MEKRILILSASDRYNYGDLLFPHVVYHLFKDTNITIDNFGIVKSDLTKHGGLVTKSIKEFYAECNNPNYNNIVIIAGGECVPVTWGNIFTSLNKYGFITRRIAAKARLLSVHDRIAKKWLRGETKFAFTFSKSNFTSVKTIIHNSLGASSILRLSKNNIYHIKKELQGIDYLSLRDEVSVNNYQELQLQPNLAPDSAIIMSEIFNDDLLKKLITKSTLDFIEGNEYIFFQASKNVAKQEGKQLAKQLDEIIYKHKKKICFCPIGLAHAHNDIDGLNKISELMTKDVHIIKDVTIWDIMYLIKNSKMYIGSSLHGTITAMSYRVPYIALEIEKLNNYIKTWSVPPFNRCCKSSEVAAAYDYIAHTDPHILNNVYFKQKESLEKSKTTILNLLQS